MRIGLVVGEYPPMQGGVGAYTQVLGRALVAQGQEVFVLTNVAARESDDDIHVSNSIQRWGMNTFAQVNAWTKTHKLDVVNIQFQTACYGMSPWIHFLPDSLRHIPVVTTFHDLRFPYLFPKAGPLRNWIVMHLVRTSNGVVVTNQEDCERLSKLPEVRLIPIGSNILADYPADAVSQDYRPRAKEGDLIVAHFGFMKQGKGIEILLESIAQLRGENLPIRLLMIGGRASDSEPTDAEYTRRIDSLIETLGLKSYVQWTGFVDDTQVTSYLRASDVVVLPFMDGASYRRGSLMAAVHYGRPIITTTPQYPTPAFVDGENMLLIPPGDPKALASAIQRLYQSPELRSKLQQGAVRLSTKFDWTNIAQNYLDFFQKLTA
jgi:glycosyltransferase involved in cell wall biosynthesis